MLKHNPQCVGVRRWGHGEVMRSWEWSLINEIKCPSKNHKKHASPPCCPPCKDTARSRPMALTRTQPRGHPDLGPLASRRVRNNSVFKPPSLQHWTDWQKSLPSVVAARTKMEILMVQSSRRCPCTQPFGKAPRAPDEEIRHAQLHPMRSQAH